VSDASWKDEPRDVQSLLRALHAALGADAPRAANEHAREVARALGLAGLDRLLAAVRREDDRGRPPGSEVAFERIRRACERALGTEGLDVFRDADAAFGIAARGLEPPAWAGGEPTPANGDVALLDVLEDWPVANRARLRSLRTRLDPRSAAALRAAIDWLTEGASHRAPLQVAVEDSVLAVVIDRARIPDASPLDALLAGVGGCAVPGGSPGAEHAPRGSCVVRLPLRSARPLHLMLRCGDTPVAVPWPNVLRFYLVPRVELEQRRAHLGVPVLASLVPLAASLTELPVVLVGLGMRRGYLVADRLVWRLPAAPCDPPGTPPPGEGWRAVCGDDGDAYWVIDPERLLQGATTPEVPAENRRVLEPSREASEAPPAPPVPLWLAARDVEPIVGEPHADSSPALAPPVAPEEEQAPAVEPSAESVRATALPDESPPHVAPTPEPSPSAARPWRASAVTPAAGWNPFASGWPHGRTVKRALIAEDSIAASLFLARMLEQRGFEVRIARRAAECFEALARDGAWDLVCVDVELPDAQGQELLRGVRERAESFDPAPILVALVRDTADLADADGAGIVHALRKPFDPDALMATLRGLGLVSEEPR
jgi:CheY-like chemotaxis protein